MAREMRDSGIEWVGAKPATWQVALASQVFSQVKCKNTGLVEQNLLSLSYGKIKRKSIDTTAGLLPESFDGYNIIERDDIVLRLTDLQNDHKSLRVGRTTERGIITSAYLSIRPSKNHDSQFLYYYLHSFDICKGLYGMGSGVRQGLNWDDIKRLQILVPPQSEQKQIASFLDRKCAEIDSVIADTQRTIEEYKKLKQTIITEAVTKGIRGERPMKDSGIQGIGDIPEEWNTVGLKFLCRMQSGKNITSEMIADEGAYPVYGGNGLRGYYSEYNTEGEYLLVGRQGALCGNVHHVAGQFWATEHAVVTTPTMLADIDFLYYLLIGMNLNQYANNTAAQPGLAVGQIQNVRTCFVPLAEQQEIASYLNKKCAEIEKLIAGKTHLLEQLESYKKSVIYEYVTGKKEVPACQ